MNNNISDFDYKKYVRLVIKQRYSFVAVALFVMTFVVINSYNTPQQYEAKCTVFIENNIINDLVKGIAVAPSFDNKLKALSYSMTSRTLLLKVFEDLQLNVDSKSAGEKEKIVRDFQKRTDVKLKGQEGLFTISFYDKNPSLARDYVNALIKRYIEESTSSKRAESTDATKILVEQISSVKTKLDEKEALVDVFKRDNTGVLGNNDSSLLGEISESQQKIEEISLKKQQLEGLLSMARKNDPLQSKLAALQSRYKELSLIYTENHPEVISVSSEIASIKEVAVSGHHRADVAAMSTPEMQRLSMELSSLRSMESNQRRMIASKMYLLRSIPAARSRLDEMERDLNSQKALYTQLVARRTGTEVAQQMGVEDKSTTFRIIDPAILPITPVKQQRSKKIVFGIIGGLLCSLALLALRDHLNTSVRSVDTLKNLGVKVLAIVPTVVTPAELQAVRKRDIWFFAVTGTYFIGILATASIELLR